MYIYNYDKLKLKITEIYNSDVNFAIKMGFSERTLCQKLNNKSEFKQSEISKACSLLGIDDNDICSYFFDLKTQYVE